MFIVFEGPKYTGKGKILDRLYQDIHDEYMVYFTKEPGGTNNCKIIREMLNKEKYTVNDTCAALLEAADRAQHCEKIQNLMDKGYTVISEGFKETSFVYRGYLKGMSSLVYNLNHVATKGFKQDLTVLVICDPEEGFNRMIDGKMSREDYFKSYEGYMELYKECTDSGEDWLLIDTTGLTAEESYQLFLEKFEPYMINLRKRE